MPSWKKAGWRKAGCGVGVIGRVLAAAGRLLGRFSADRGGNVFVIFGLSATVLVIAIGAGIDLANAYVARQKLSNVAALTCQFANRNAILTIIDNGSSGSSNYQSTVKTFYTNSIAQQTFPTAMHIDADASKGPQITASGTSSVAAGGKIDTNFMQIIGVPSLPLAVTVPCGSNPTPAQPSGGTIIKEGFENSPCVGACYIFIQPNGQTGTAGTSNTSTPSTASYYGSGGTQWRVIGYCLEIDGFPLGHSATSEGTHSAELDCDNGNGSAGNSSISTLLSLAVGEYELRYLYESRIAYLNYMPTYVCGSTASDVSWANDTYSFFYPFYGNFVARTNQINVYFDKDVGGTIPLHTTIDGTQQLGGTNLIDTCVDSYNWIERSVRISVTTAGNYWLSFAADGQNDSFGGQLDNIRLCTNPCPGTLQDNFPFTANQLLFEDKFDSPATSESCNGCGNVNSTLDASYGTSPGWPNQAQRGWVTAPYNQMVYEIKGPSSQGGQSIQVQGNKTGSQTTSNRSISRYFYLDPGYYRIDYNYVSNVTFSFFTNYVDCTYPPYNSGSFSIYAAAGASTTPGFNRLTLTPYPAVYGNTNELAVFMSHSLMASTPNGGGPLNSATTYTNATTSNPTPTTTTTTPTTPPDTYSLSNYNTAQPNPLIDRCWYSSDWSKSARTTYVKIVKPGQYWLTFSSKGTNDNYGAVIDDVKLTALRSLYGTAPAFFVTIPAPGPTPGSSISYTGFSIVADPLTPPAP